jgi:hypothetical protein
MIYGTAQAIYLALFADYRVRIQTQSLNPHKVFHSLSYTFSLQHSKSPLSLSAMSNSGDDPSRPIQPPGFQPWLPRSHSQTHKHCSARRALPFSLVAPPNDSNGDSHAYVHSAAFTKQSKLAVSFH